MARVLIIAALVSGCVASTVVGASVTTAAALGASGAQRASGGCYAVCTNGTACNPHTGMCERMPCDGLCGREEHCETTFAESRCVPGAPSDVASKAPGTGKTLPVLPPPPSVSGGPPQVIPAAEQNPPSH